MAAAAAAMRGLLGRTAAAAAMRGLLGMTAAAAAMRGLLGRTAASLAMAVARTPPATAVAVAARTPAMAFAAGDLLVPAGSAVPSALGATAPAFLPGRTDFTTAGAALGATATPLMTRRLPPAWAAVLATSGVLTLASWARPLPACLPSLGILLPVATLAGTFMASGPLAAAPGGTATFRTSFSIPIAVLRTDRGGAGQGPAQQGYRAQESHGSQARGHAHSPQGSWGRQGGPVS